MKKWMMSAVLCGTALMIPITANAVTAYAGPRFDVDVRLVNALKSGPMQTADLKIMISAHDAAQAVSVQGTIDAVTSGKRQMIATFGCNVGDLAAGQGTIYSANSCGPNPDPPIVPVGVTALEATFVVIFTGGKTGSYTIPVSAYPPGMTFDGGPAVQPKATRTTPDGR